MNCGASLSTDPEKTEKSARRPVVWAAIIGGTVLLIALVALVFFLLFPRANGDITIDPAKGSTMTLADGAQLLLLPEGLSGRLRLRQPQTIPADQFRAENLKDDPALTSAAEQIPSILSLQSQVYRFEIEDGSMPTKVQFSLPLVAVANSPHSLDLYAWEESGWQWIPAHVDGQSRLVADLESLPQALALFKREPVEPIITAEISGGETLPAEAEQVVTELLVTGFTVQGDGSIENNPNLSNTGYRAMLIPSLRNWHDDGRLTAAVGEILADPARRQRHREAIVGLALAGGYRGVQLDYRQLDPTHRQLFSTFVVELAIALHAQERFLIVRVDPPIRIAETRWATGAYDWAAITQAADRLQVPLPTIPTDLAEGKAEIMLSWAVGQVSRSKLEPIVSLEHLDSSNFGPIPDTLAHLGPLQLSEAVDSLSVGDSVRFSLANLGDGTIEIDPATGMLHLADPDQT
ncbi:MAG: hypothetical protein AB1801_25265, partial [Chloroflexota bacterium]